MIILKILGSILLVILIYLFTTAMFIICGLQCLAIWLLKPITNFFANADPTDDNIG